MTIWNEITQSIKTPDDTLELGAGHNASDDCVSQDIRSLPGINDVFDITEIPWPYDDNSFRSIRALDIFEHIPLKSTMDDRDPLIRVMEECFRVLQQNGHLALKFPIPNQKHDRGDLTHYRQIEPRQFVDFDPNRGRWGKSFTTSARFTIKQKEQSGHNWIVLLQAQ